MGTDLSGVSVGEGKGEGFIRSGEEEEIAPVLTSDSNELSSGDGEGGGTDTGGRGGNWLGRDVSVSFLTDGGDGGKGDDESEGGCGGVGGWSRVVFTAVIPSLSSDGALVAVGG